MVAASRSQTAAEAVSRPGEIDWALYKAKLPDLDVDALRRDYEAYVGAIPAISYDATADAAGVPRAKRRALKRHVSATARPPPPPRIRSCRSACREGAGVGQVRRVLRWACERAAGASGGDVFCEPLRAHCRSAPPSAGACSTAGLVQAAQVLPAQPHLAALPRPLRVAAQQGVSPPLRWQGRGRRPTACLPASGTPRVQVRGEWNNEIWAAYINYKARNVALPWESTHGDVTEAKRDEIISEIASRTGLSKEELRQ